MFFFAFADGTLPGGYCYAAETRLPDVLVGDAPIKKSSMASYKVIIKKNLFNPERTEKWKINVRQPAQSKAARLAARKPDTRGDMILEGVIIFDGQRSALIRERAARSGGATTVVVGDVVGAYKVTSIEDEEVVLNGAGGERTLTLFKFDEPARRRHIKTNVRAVNPVPSRPATRTNPGIRTNKVEPKANVPHRSK